MEIIGLSGLARSGKDEAAGVLVREFGFTRVAFADKLREVLYELNPIVGEYGWTNINGAINSYKNRLKDVIDEYGWNGYKETRFGPEIRYLLQRLGTEAGRETLWDTIWIDAAFAGLPDDAKIVISDARFINEFEAVKSRGGQIWRIERPGIELLGNHPSETEALSYDGFDYTIHNDGTLHEYYATVRLSYLIGKDMTCA